MVDVSVRNSVPSVLVVDDLHINRVLLCRMLKMLNVTVLEASNGAEALQLYQTVPNVSVVFLDLVMPRIDGLTTAACIRALEAASDKPATTIIAYTAEEHDHVREDGTTMRSACQRSGMDDYLSKPVSLEQVKQVLQRYLPGQGDPPATAAPPAPLPTDAWVRQSLSAASAANVEQHQLRSLLRREQSESELLDSRFRASHSRRVSLEGMPHSCTGHLWG